MDPVRMLLWIVLFPLAWGGLMFVGGSRVGPRMRPVMRGLAFLPGLWVPYATSMGMPAWPPRDAMHWLLWLTALLVVLPVLLAQVKIRAAGAVIRVLAVAGFALALLQAPLSYEWSAATGVAWVIGLGVAVGLAWHGANQALARVTPVMATFVPALVAGFAAIALAASGSLVLGEMGGAFAMLLVAAWLVAWRRGGDAALASTALSAFVLVGLSLVLQGLVYADLPAPTAIALAAVAPLALALAARSGGARQARGRVALALVLGLGVAGAFVAKKNLETAAAGDEDMYR